MSRRFKTFLDLEGTATVVNLDAVLTAKARTADSINVEFPGRFETLRISLDFFLLKLNGDDKS